MKLKILSLFIISAFFVSCSSKSKNTSAEATAKTPAKQEAAKATDKKQAKTSTTPAKSATSANASSVVCKNGSDTRTVEVVSKDGGCEVSYTKFDQTTTPATAASGTEHCANVQDKIKGNLETAGFKCE